MNVISKITGFAVTLALAAVVAAPSASALTSADIQLLVSLGVIPADKAAAAMAVVDNNNAVGNATGSCGFTYTRNLTLGSTGADVVAIQTYLEGKGTLVIPTGVSKGYFGPLTRSALASYQASVGIAPAVGYFGPITMGRVTADCATSNNGGNTNNGGGNMNSDLNGGEASLTDYDRRSAYTNEDLEEGETAKVFEAEFEVEDADAKIERIDVQFQADDLNEEDEPWEQIESIALYINGDMVDEMDVDDEDDWSEENTNTEAGDDFDAYEIRFSGLDEIVREDEDVTVTIEVTSSDSIDDGDLDSKWFVFIPDNGIRAIDAEGIDQYTGDDEEVTSFTIQQADDGDVSIRESDDDPDSAILIVDEDDDSTAYEVFRFEINNEDADIFLNELTIVASSSAGDIDDVISQLMVSIDGEEFDYDTASTTAGNVGEFVFEFEDNDDEIPVEEDEDIEVVVMVEFNQTGDNGSNYADGTMVQFGVGKINDADYGAIALDAEGQNSGDTSDVSGRQESEIHVLRTEGIVAEGVSKSATVDEVEVVGEEETGVFEIEVQVTALEDDAWIPSSVAESASTTVGFTYSITGTAFTGNVNAFISDDTTDSETNGRLKISEGSSERFTIYVELDPNATGSYGVELQEINFSSTSAGTLVEYSVPDETEFETKKLPLDA